LRPTNSSLIFHKRSAAFLSLACFAGFFIAQSL
jgi:hypothetical protein